MRIEEHCICGARFFGMAKPQQWSAIAARHQRFIRQHERCLKNAQEPPAEPHNGRMGFGQLDIVPGGQTGHMGE